MAHPVQGDLGQGAALQPAIKKGFSLGIWGFAFGYFACYAPYSALTKAMSSGLLPGMDGAGIAGFQLLPVTAMASMVGMFCVLSFLGWWKYANHWTIFGLSIPRPGKWTFMSGICTATIIPTTTLAYTFSGVSIVFMMLLMRGGVLIIAPIVDRVTNRRVRWFSWVALGLSLMALLVSLIDTQGYELTLVAALDVIIYLAAYFGRLRFMSKMAKSNDDNARIRYFVEEQMVATPLLVSFLALVAVLGGGHSEMASAIRSGFTTFFSEGAMVVPVAILIGILSQGTGIFGGLILLDKRENTFCVPVNRVSSIFSGLIATLFLWMFLGQRFPSSVELIGASLIILAIVTLSVPPLVEKSRKKKLKDMASEDLVVAGSPKG